MKVIVTGATGYIGRSLTRRPVGEATRSALVREPVRAGDVLLAASPP
jgi:nucleoside-diphosphate-sugar epimerase